MEDKKSGVGTQPEEAKETAAEPEAVKAEAQADNQETAEAQAETDKKKNIWRIKEFFRSKKGKCCLAAAVLLGLGYLGYALWLYCQPKFHDVTVELGTETIGIESFMTEYADVRKASIVTDLSTVDIGKVGNIPLVMRNGGQEETVTLTIEDTTPPEAEFISQLRQIPSYVPDPNDFVVSYSDFSDVTVSFLNEVEIPPDYGDVDCVVAVTDSSGNMVTERCTLSITWMLTEYTLELGEELTKEKLLVDPKRDGDKLNQEDLDVINASGVGDYTVASTVEGVDCKVHVEDTAPPELVLKDAYTYPGRAVTAKNFVDSCFDYSGDVELTLLTEPDVDKLGNQDMTVEAKDIYGNTVTAEAVLHVTTDTTPPTIRGLTKMSVSKNSEPDYMSGVTAMDGKDGLCEVSCDVSGVDLSEAGTYYAVYSATDNSGNTAVVKRTVTVQHDSSDTAALVSSIAAGLSSDPEAIRDYVRNSIKYNTNWGGNDPVWYGFTNRVGNCYVHNLCLQSLLNKKGYTTQLIWTTDKTHYWLIINLNGVWRHIDATPGTRHTVYSLMTDEQRLSCLQGRTWDHSAWPACE